jgi:hypothetical protein
MFPGEQHRKEYVEGNSWPGPDATEIVPKNGREVQQRLKIPRAYTGFLVYSRHE